ncbi:MAG: hypothetical protein U0929_10125 [Planctomycetaceae bacterium]
MNANQCLEAALQLTEAQRLQLASALIDSVPSEAVKWEIDDPEFLDELDRRLKDGTPAIPWSQIRNEFMSE